MELAPEDAVPALEIEPDLASKLIGIYGAEGRDWIARFPALLERFRAQWDVVEVGAAFAYVGGAWVRPALLRDGRRAVLKLAPPDKELASEAAAMSLYDGDGAARLLAADTTAVALLLERLEPGDTLATLADDIAATEIAGVTMRRLFRPLPADHPFITIERWGQAFHRVRERYGGGCGKFPADLFEPASRLYFELCASAGPTVLVHGDLHHYNILRATREPWLAIDPKGLAGEAAYEVGPLLYNRLDAGHDVKALTLRRIAQLAEILGLDRQRLTQWGFAQAVLSDLWHFEDSGEVRQEHLRVAWALREEI